MGDAREKSICFRRGRVNRRCPPAKGSGFRPHTLTENDLLARSEIGQAYSGILQSPKRKDGGQRLSGAV